MAEIKRQTAYKASIKQILDAKYIVNQGWEPNYLMLGDIKASRLNIIAVIISQESNIYTIEDGTGKIKLRTFDEKKYDIKTGDLVLIIGRPRVFNDSKYVVLEIIKKLEDKQWLIQRKEELKHLKIKPTNSQIIEQPVPETKSPLEIITKIKELDKGEGVNYEELIKSINSKEAEKYIEILMNEGEIFEIRPGYIKVLD
ncbi:MAG: hypothetical protein ACMXX6_00490 [Candidatus Woesearchaeota archaeon]